MSWVITNPARWKIEQDSARSLLLNVSASVEGDGCALIKGLMYVQRESLDPLGPFALKILYAPNFPAHDPNVYLVNRPEWRSLVNHIEEDGRFCWSEVKDARINFERPDSLKLLLQNIAFRLAQVEIRERKGLQSYPGPDRKHYEAGEYQANADRKRRGIGPNTRPCICGKDIKYKHCHGKRSIFRRRNDDKFS